METLIHHRNVPPQTPSMRSGSVNKIHNTTIALMKMKKPIAMATLLRKSQHRVFTTEIQPVVWQHSLWVGMKHLILHTRAHRPLLNVIKWSIINESAGDLFLTQGQLFHCRDLKANTVVSPPLALSVVNLPDPSRCVRIHTFTRLSWPLEASRNSTQQPSAEGTTQHILNLSDWTQFYGTGNKIKRIDMITLLKTWNSILLGSKRQNI